jgi:hypothetical protein
MAGGVYMFFYKIRTTVRGVIPSFLTKVNAKYQLHRQLLQCNQIFTMGDQVDAP